MLILAKPLWTCQLLESRWNFTMVLVLAALSRLAAAFFSTRTGKEKTA